jgi:hypothetical protein
MRLLEERTKMMRSTLAVSLILLAGTAAAQDPAVKPKQKDKPIIVVTGCVDGTWLQVRKTDAIGSYAERYKLHAPKQLLKEIEKSYKGHLLEVTGAVTDTGNTTHRGRTIEVGQRTRITTGAKDVPLHPSGTGDPTLEIDTFRDLKDSCK